jgi:hypothetical protein
MNEARIFINGTNYTPDVLSDLNDLAEHIWYDVERKAFLQEITGTITLGGEGFRYFQNLLRTNYDTQVPCTLSRFDDYAGVWETVLHGLVFVTDCKFDLYAQTVEVQLVDNSYFAKIENNKGIEFVIGSGRSKNGVNISNIATSTQIKVLNGLDTGILTYLPSAVTGWSRYEAMKYLVAAMTDNEIGFYSDFLQDYLDPVQNVLNNGFLFSGEALRDGAFQYGPNISFDYCYNDLAKLYNLVQYIDRDSNGNLRLRVEKFDDIRQSNSVFVEHVDTGVAEMINSDTLYSTVILGSKEEELDGYFPFTPFLATFEEQYSMSYKSNIDKELDLRMQAFITDTNIIYYTQTQQGLTDPDRTYDNDVFYIICRRYNGVDWDEKGFAYAFYTPSPYILNYDIRNVQVLLNNFTGLPATIFKQYQNLFNTGFSAKQSGPYVVSPDLVGSSEQYTPVYKLAFFPYPPGFNWNDSGTGTFVTGPDFTHPTFVCEMDDDSTFPQFDGGGNYNTTLWQYVVPVSGTYSFKGQIEAIIELQASPQAFYPLRLYGTKYIKAHIIRDDGTNITSLPVAYNNQFFYSGNSPQPEIATPPTQPFTVYPRRLIYAITQEVNLNAGDIIKFALEIYNITPPDNLESWFLYTTENNYFEVMFSNIENSSIGGEIVSVQDGNNYLLKNEWTGNIPLPTWEQILAAPFGQLRYQVNDAGEQRNMWVLDMTRNLLSGVTEAQLTGRLVDEVPSELPSFEPGEGPEEEGDGG